MTKQQNIVRGYKQKTHFHSILVVLHQLTLLLVSVGSFFGFNNCHHFGYCHCSFLLKIETTKHMHVLTTDSIECKCFTVNARVYWQCVLVWITHSLHMVRCRTSTAWQLKLKLYILIDCIYMCVLLAFKWHRLMHILICSSVCSVNQLVITPVSVRLQKQWYLFWKKDLFFFFLLIKQTRHAGTEKVTEHVPTHL